MSVHLKQPHRRTGQVQPPSPLNGTDHQRAAAPPEATTGDDEWKADLVGRMGRIEALLLQMIEQKAVKEWYTTEEVAQFLERKEYTVREWCRKGQVPAMKAPNGRSWLISHDNLTLLRNQGPLPETQADRVLNG